MQTKNGFTLIELLIVVAIICILSAFLVPRVGTSMERAREQHCRNNLRQLQAAVVAYAQDHDGNLPFASSYETYDSSSGVYTEHRGWISWNTSTRSLADLDRLWQGNSAKSSHSSEMRDDVGVGNYGKAGIDNGTLFDYVREYRFYVCPAIERWCTKRYNKDGASSSDAFDDGSSSRTYKVYRTYAMNPFFGSPANFRRYWRVKSSHIGVTETYNAGLKGGTDIPTAAQLLLFTEVFPSLSPQDSISRGGYHDTMRGSDRNSDCILDPEKYNSNEEYICYEKDSGTYGIHKTAVKDVNGALAVFFDGHIEMVYPRVDGKAGGANTVWFLNRGFKPVNNPDYAN